MPSTIRSQATSSLSGHLPMPGDKSISHRALIFSALAHGRSEISNFLESEDCLATAEALRSLGVTIEYLGQASVAVEGCAGQGLHAEDGITLDLGNSGTSMRLLSGVLCAQSFSSHLSGDSSLNRRPMGRIQEPLAKMGAVIRTSQTGTPPIDIDPCQGLQGIDYAIPYSSAQVKSCLLLAGMFAQGKTTVREPVLSRDHTERMFETFGYPIERDANSVTIEGGGSLQATSIRVPGDISSAMFFIVAACITEQSDIVLQEVGINPSRTSALEILQRMGARIDVMPRQHSGSEPSADIRARSSVLHAVDITAAEVPGAIDEFPILFIAAACAQGKTTLRGAKELRMKESDRIATMARGLERCGIDCETSEDGISITGGSLKGASIDACNDHRIAMSFAVAGTVSDSAVQIQHSETIASSFPNFLAYAQSLGFDIHGD